MLFRCLWLFGSLKCLVRTQIKLNLKVLSLSFNRGGSVEKNCNFTMFAVNQVKMMIRGSGGALKHFSLPEVSSVILTPFSHTTCLQYPLIMMNKTYH